MRVSPITLYLLMMPVLALIGGLVMFWLGASEIHAAQRAWMIYLGGMTLGIVPLILLTNPRQKR